MTTITVTTQAELDDALATHGADCDTAILISSPEDVWLKVTATGSANITATGSASVYATDSATVYTTDSASVYATGSASVYATDSN